MRKKGWKVRVGHYRNLHKFNPQTGKKSGKKHVLLSEWKSKYDDYYLSSHGGKTMITITIPMFNQEVFGVVECSQEEKYNKSFGIKKATAIALSYLINNKLLVLT